MRQHLIIDQDALTRKDAAKVAVFQHAPLHNQIPGRKILEDDQIFVAISKDALRFAQAGKQNIAAVRWTEANDLKRRGSLVIDADVILVVGVELINDVDRLGRHAQLGHEGIVRDDLFLLQACLGDQVVKLNAEEDLSFVIEVGRELLSDRVEVLMLVQRLAKELSQLGINRVGIVIAQKP